MRSDNGRPAYCPPYRPMIELFPEEKRVGNWLICHKTLDEEFVKHEQMMSIFSHSYGETHDLEAGTYVELREVHPQEDGSERYSFPIMSDTPMERRTNRMFVNVAKGEVLIAGLGIGMVLWPLLQKEDVTAITVIELEPEVIEMVEPVFQPIAGKTRTELTVIEASIFDWPLPKDTMWDTIYFDVWADICGDNWSEMKTLNRRFSRRVNVGGWKGAWRKGDMRERATGVWRDDYREGFRKEKEDA